MRRKIIITLKGNIDNKWSDWFDELQIEQAKDITTLKGEVLDNAKLHGILNRIRDLNLELISLNPDHE